jgi:hypothetical protein
VFKQDLGAAFVWYVIPEDSMRYLDLADIMQEAGAIKLTKIDTLLPEGVSEHHTIPEYLLDFFPSYLIGADAMLRCLRIEELEHSE